MRSDQGTVLSRRYIILLALTAPFSGCGKDADGLPRVEVSGKVSNNGSPIKEG